MKVYFIGIGGIGTSALAQYYLSRGHKVYGSDLVSSGIIELLERKGIKVFIGSHKKENLPEGIDLLVYSPAVKEENPELKEAKRRDIKIKSYPEALGEITKDYYTVAVSGTHGKSTVCAMLSLVLKKAGLDPTVIIGTRLKEFEGSNFRAGKSSYLVIEADEWGASFLNYHPDIIVLNNIELEHMDFYNDMEDIIETYSKYASNLKEKGVLVLNGDDKNISELKRNLDKASIEEFSIKQKESERLKDCLKVPGEHNVYNALAVLRIARLLKIPDETVFESLSEYRGSWRRFEVSEGAAGDKKFTLITDYAHHPTEIRATLKAAREKYPHAEIWCLFQPHQYQRTYYLFKDFVKAFSKAPVDKIIITDVYDVAGREEKEIREKVNAEKLADSIQKEAVFYLSKDKVEQYLKENLRGGEILIIMGAGDIYRLAEKFSTQGV